MKNLFLNINLTIISICLVTLIARELPLISVAKADGVTHCVGTFIANQYGTVDPNIGGYNVDVKCG